MMITITRKNRILVEVHTENIASMNIKINTFDVLKIFNRYEVRSLVEERTLF